MSQLDNKQNDLAQPNQNSGLGEPVLELRDTSVVFKTRTGSLFCPNKVQASKHINF